MKTYIPKLEIRLVKTDKRKNISDSNAAASRFQNIGALDLTQFLPEGSPVQLQKSISSPSGSWGFSLVDRYIAEFGESLYALIEPMDIVEFRLARSPHEYSGTSLPVVMRGFVSSIIRSRTMSGDNPQRVVSVSGHDYGKILQILRIYYLNNSVIGDNILGNFRFFQKYAGLNNSKIMSGNDFARLVVDKVVNPYVETLTSNLSGSKVDAAVVSSFSLDCDIEGTISPNDVSTFNDGDVGQLLSRYLDIGAFNELLVEDRDDGVHLVIRKNPYLTPTGDPIQDGASLETIDIDDSHIESITESRSDSGVANYFWVTNNAWQIIFNMPMRELANASATDEYALFEYPNTSAARYGFRKMEVSSEMGPDFQKYSDATSGQESSTEGDKLMEWLVSRRKILADQNKDNVVFEHGQMVLRGNEKIKVGQELRVKFGSSFTASYYVTGVAHQFLPFQSFKTIVTFERGTNFIERSQINSANYLSEMNMKGAV